MSFSVFLRIYIDFFQVSYNAHSRVQFSICYDVYNEINGHIHAKLQALLHRDSPD